MGQRKGVILHEQWDACDRCGFFYPLSELHSQHDDVNGTLRVCYLYCTDRLDNIYREKKIAEILGQETKEEGTDQRGVDRAWFTTATAAD